MPFTKKLSPSHGETTGKQKQKEAQIAAKSGIKIEEGIPAMALCSFWTFLDSDRPELQEVFCLTYCRTGPAPPVVPRRLLSRLALAKEADGSLPDGSVGRRRSSLAIATFTPASAFCSAGVKH